MEFFKANTKIDFMQARKWAALFSIILCAGSIIALCVNGLHFGLDFTGGLQMEVTYKQAANMSQIRTSLAKNGFKDATVQLYGSRQDVLITMALPEKKGAAQDKVQGQVQRKVMSLLPGAHLQRADFIGPQLGKELATKGALALVVALIGTMIYILLRFEYRFAVSSAVALLHDPILILGIFALFKIEFDVNTLAALLAVIGYSLNDTIVVFDRVRENFRKMRKGTPAEVLNASINQTLSRTIMTSVLTLLVVVVLYFYGGQMIHNFSLAMIIGIVIGTYSSIYVAGALALTMGLNKQDLMPTPRSGVRRSPLMARTLRHTAMDFLSRREYSTEELRQRLRRKEFDHNDIEQALNKLISDNLLSDRRFCESYLRYRANRGFGLSRIRQELAERGINAEMANSTEQALTIDWQQNAEEVLLKKFTTVAKDDFTLRAKQMKFLQYRGFRRADYDRFFQ